ncbi:MAG: nucleotidyl transferase AbiEii/AbiGii toxin family protein [Deferribacteraceae bacterium]|jgi:hypothetical protein|nr:nucleotidyl transferase AbiEii/AbiGii toxin family protein [Deferribacteraceae bacterium]
MKWEFLLEKALIHISNTPLKTDDWSLGGGTVLMFYYKHRLSKDIDIFVNDIQLLAYTSPKISSPIEKSILSYIDGALFTKIILKEGDIDFICGGNLTNFPNRKMNFKGQDIFLQHPTEIIAKKVHYRGDTFTVRDIYDLSVVMQNEKDSIIANKEIFAPKMEVINKRLDKTLKEKTILKDDKIISYDDKQLPINLKEHIYNVKKLAKELNPKINIEKSKTDRGYGE